MKKSCISQGNTIIKTKFFHELGKAAYPMLCVTPVKEINPKFMLPLLPATIVESGLIFNYLSGKRMQQIN